MDVDEAEARELVESLRAEAGPPLAISTLHRQPPPVSYLIFDTQLTDGRTLLVGKGRGGLQGPSRGPGLWMSETARRVAARLVEGLPDETEVLFCAIQDPRELRGRMQAAFDLVGYGQPIMFLAPTDRMLALMTVLLGLHGPLAPPGTLH